MPPVYIFYVLVILYRNYFRYLRIIDMEAIIVGSYIFSNVLLAALAEYRVLYVKTITIYVNYSDMNRI